MSSPSHIDTGVLERDHALVVELIQSASYDENIDIQSIYDMQDGSKSELLKISVQLKANNLSLDTGKIYFVLVINKRRWHNQLNIMVNGTTSEENKTTQF